MLIDQAHYQIRLLVDRLASNDRPDFLDSEIDEAYNMAHMEFIKTRYNIDKSVFTDKSRLMNTLGFETNQKRIDELASIHVKSPEVQPAITPIILGNGLYEFRLNDLGNNINGQYFRYLYLTKIVLTIKKGNCLKTIDGLVWQIDNRKTSYSASSWKWNRALANFGKSSDILTSIPNTNLNSPDYSIGLANGANNTFRYENDRLKSVFIDTRNRLGDPEFEVVQAYISYIKYPNRVCRGTYVHIDKNNPIVPGTQIHSDMDDSVQDEIVRIAVRILSESIQDQIGSQIANKNTTENFTS
jgi:hypothetical protein